MERSKFRVKLHVLLPIVIIVTDIEECPVPISTPPNAIAASTGLVETKDMAKVGVIIGVIGFVFGFFWVTKIFPF